MRSEKKQNLFPAESGDSNTPTVNGRNVAVMNAKQGLATISEGTVNTGWLRTVKEWARKL